MTLSEIATYRLISQQLQGNDILSASEMVAYFGAVQGQEFGPSKWGLGLRLPHLNDNDIEKDFTDGKILRTHLLRPTWHFVAAEDIRWLLKLTAPRVNAANSFMYRKMELTTSDFNKCNSILIKMLEGDKQLTRDVLNDAFRENKIQADGTRLTCIMMKAELDGIICSGARQGKQFTYALLEERVPKAEEKSHEESLSELTKRYFNARGPATVKDFATWSGLSMADCRKGISMTEHDFESVVVEHETYYFRERITSQKAPGNLFLLPIYDECIMGYKNRSALLQFHDKINARLNIVFDNMMLFEGQIIGSWKRVIKPKHIEIDCNFLATPTKTQWAAFEECTNRFEAFYNMPVHYKNKTNPQT